MFLRGNKVKKKGIRGKVTIPPTSLDRSHKPQLIAPWRSQPLLCITNHPGTLVADLKGAEIVFSNKFPSDNAAGQRISFEKQNYRISFQSWCQDWFLRFFQPWDIGWIHWLAHWPDSYQMPPMWRKHCIINWR